MTELNQGSNPTELHGGAQNAPEKSIWGIMAGVFTAPTEAFAAFKAKPSILMPLIVIFVLTAGVAALMAEYGAMMQVEMLQNSTVIPPEALEQMRQEAIEPNRLTAGLFGGLAVIIFGIISALIAWFLGSVIFGQKAKFSAVWGVELLAGLIAAVGGILRIPMVYAKGTMFVSYGLAALMPGKDFTSILYSLLYYADIFAVWSLIVAGIGYSAIFGLSKAKGTAIAVIAFLLIIIVTIAMTTVGMSFAGVDISFI